METVRYLVNDLFIGDCGFIFNLNQILWAVNKTNNFVQKKVSVAVLDAMPNLSIGDLVSNIFIRKFCKITGAYKNPNDNGYPDILIQRPMTIKDTVLFHVNRPGLEVKTTGGTLNDKINCLYEYSGPRIHYLKGASFSAHHQLTNCVLGIMYDCIGEKNKPVITLITYSNSLVPKDWGTPNVGEKSGHNGSLKKSGRVKLFNNWAIILDHSMYVSRYSKIFGHDIPPMSISQLKRTETFGTQYNILHEPPKETIILPQVDWIYEDICLN